MTGLPSSRVPLDWFFPGMMTTVFDKNSSEFDSLTDSELQSTFQGSSHDGAPNRELESSHRSCRSNSLVSLPEHIPGIPQPFLSRDSSFFLAFCAITPTPRAASEIFTDWRAPKSICSVTAGLCHWLLSPFHDFQAPFPWSSKTPFIPQDWG